MNLFANKSSTHVAKLSANRTKEIMLPNYFQPKDVEDRLKRKVVFYSTNQIPLSFVQTVDKNWWCIVQVNEVYGYRILTQLFEVRVRNDDDPKYMQEVIQEYCERMHIPWKDPLPDENIQRKNQLDMVSVR